MIDHYNAFISYKHEPKDIAIAKNVQKSLERYRIPKKLRESTGVNKIDRIFRDTDELPLTSDLSETIYDALDKSDYLIVICSTKTKESQWVNKEIEYFISKHSRKDVLTVLVDGEPSEVVPEILTYEEKNIVDENGNEKIIRKDLEPLSCDYRNIKEANKKELPRLVSTLIGCSYDELVNRQKAYKTRKAIISLSITVAIGTLFILQLIYGIYRINKNYMTVLENKSKYLANESMNQMKNGQRILALQLALNALPSDNNREMPITSEAERAIIDATGVYNTNENDKYYNDFSYQMPSMLMNLSVNEAETKLAACDISGAVSLWDIESHKQIFLKKISLQVYDQKLTFINDNTLLVWNGFNISAYDTNSGETKWSQDYDQFILLNNNNSSDSVKLVDINNTLHELDVETGYELKTKKLNLEEPLLSLKFSERLSPDGNSVLVVYTNEDKYDICTLNLSNNKLTEIYETDEYINEIFWSDENNIIVVIDPDLESKYINYSFDYDDYTMERGCLIYCFDTYSGAEKWHNFESQNISTDICEVKNDFDNNIIYFAIGELIVGYDIDSGKELYRYNLNDRIVSFNIAGEDHHLECILQNGNYGKNVDKNNSASNTMYLSETFPDYTDFAYLSDDKAFIFKEESNEILSYTNKALNNDYTSLYELKDNSQAISEYLDNNYLFLERTGVDDAAIEIFNKNNNEHYSIDITDIKDGITGILGSNNEYVYIYNDDFENINIRKTKIKTGDYKDIKIEGNTAFNYCRFDNDTLICPVLENDHIRIKYYDLTKEDATPEVFDLPEETILSEVIPSYNHKEHIVYYSGKKDYIINIKTGEITNVQLPEDWDSTKSISNILNGNILVSNKNTVLKINLKGEAEFKIEKPGFDIKGLYLYTDKHSKDKIVILYPKNLSRYNIDTGENENNTGVSLSFYDIPEMFKIVDKDTLIIKTDSKDLCIIDTKNWYEKAIINYAIDLQNDKLFTYKAGNNLKIGYFDYLSINELIDKGNELLHGKELTDEQKSYYGIED